MLNDRKKEILQAIIEEYIQTAEPVSSNGIVQKYNLDYSSATVRNEMADLEKEGFLDKPHTSAGRVPSAKGYRFYVDELLKEDNISLEEVVYLQSKLQTKVKLRFKVLWRTFRRKKGANIFKNLTNFKNEFDTAN